MVSIGLTANAYLIAAAATELDLTEEQSLHNRL